LHGIVHGLPRCRSSALRIEVEVNAFFVGQPSLDLSGHVVGEHLIAARFDCAQHLSNYLQIREAQRLMESGKANGKIAVKVSATGTKLASA
jgi:hypothetical protein